jgi:hypothetical protein
VSNVEPPAADGTASLHPEIAIRVVRTLSAITVELDQVMAEELERLGSARALLDGGAALPDHVSRFRLAVSLVRRDARLLGHPLVAEIATSMQMILDSLPADSLPLDVIDAHIETMTAVLTDRTLGHDRAAALVADLAAAAREYVAGAGTGSGTGRMPQGS